MLTSLSCRAVKLGPLNKTRFDGMCYQMQGPGNWRFVDTSDGREAAVGPSYHSKAEILADLTRYATEYGCATV